MPSKSRHNIVYNSVGAGAPPTSPYFLFLFQHLFDSICSVACEWSTGTLGAMFWPFCTIVCRVSSTKTSSFTATPLASIQLLIFSLFSSSNFIFTPYTLIPPCPYVLHSRHICRTVAKLFRRGGGAGGASDEQRGHGLL